METVGGSLREYGRGVAGGLMFSLPLLYTMEVWWTGFIARPERLLVYVVVVFALLLGYNRYAGIRHDAGWLEVMVDSVEELGLGILTSATVLYFLGRIHLQSGIDEVVGKIVVEAGIVAIGFSVGTAQLGGDDDGDTGTGADDEEAPTPMSQLTIAFCGAVLFAANVAPTEEILVIAMETSPLKLIALAAISLATGALILYFSDFARAKRYARTETHWQRVVGSTMTYAVALIASAFILWFFDRFTGNALVVNASEIIVLAFPGVLGASAGRLLLQ